MQLLVSPSSLEEARSASAADIIDVKRPAEGSLGANFPWVIRAIAKMTDKPVSAAIGDFDNRPGGAALTALGAAAAGADYIKCGLMVDALDQAECLAKAVVRAVKESYPAKKVVIAAYSDFERLGTVSPFSVVPLAAEAGADLVMVDTGKKDGRSTFEFMDEGTLSRFVELGHDAGLGVALAGSLTFDDLPTLRRIEPDIIGVRGMVCGGDRNGNVQEELVLRAIAAIR
ncbi:MAG TPA: (5-formylfuran-3-yl)methyl phosphate synthase [Methanoregulaceae archaeon]|nr:(5-formylfuran-3-yl)methyl phosphate synthase [Methanoregulaceae archaeon]HQJ88825.1 (5-formylfuran-3-yl)methyl phosphate synthase [Methanoregulaceae archaeon]